MSIPAKLPDSWQMVTISDVGRVTTGSTPPTSNPGYYGGHIPFVKPPDLTAGPIENTSSSLTKVGAAVTRPVPAGSVLVGCIGSLGKVGLASETVAFNQQINAITPSEGCAAKWLLYGVQTSDFLSQLASSASATTVAIVNKSKFSSLRIPLAPREEQARIVDTLDSYLSRLDETTTLLDRVQRNLKRYRASVLKAAVEGRLVPTEAELARAEKRDYEPASVLLERILTERRQRWEKEGRRGKYVEPEPPDTKSLPGVPEGWCWATVDQLSVETRYGSSAKCLDEVDGGVPVLRMGNIVDGELQTVSLKYLPKDHDEFPDLLLQHGDLLFNRTNSAELVGKSAVYRDQNRPMSFASYLIRVRFARQELSGYVAAYLNSPYGRQWVADVAVQQVGQANVNGTKLRACAIPLPPLAEQARINEEADRLFSNLKAALDVADRNAKRCSRLRQSILKWAFEGKLVDQDPNDEPASALLARIKGEQPATAAPKAAPRARRKAVVSG